MKPTASNTSSPVQTQPVAVNMGRPAWKRIFSTRSMETLAEKFDIQSPAGGEDSHFLFGSPAAEVMFTSWAAQPLDADLLRRFPKLRLVVHGAGSIKALLTEAATDQGIRFCSGMHVNAQPVAEFCLGVILCDLKRVFRFRRSFEQASDLNAAWWGTHEEFDGGYYHTKIGLVGWGAISRALAALLKPFDMDVFVFSRHLSCGEMQEYGVQSAELDWIMTHCDVVSLHSAETPANHHLINARNLSLMKPGSCLINTARGGVVDEAALIEALSKDAIWAVLDVAQQEPPPAGHPFYTLPNCVLTPHVSGSIGTETNRLGDYCLREMENYFAGRDLENEIDLHLLTQRA